MQEKVVQIGLGGPPNVLWIYEHINAGEMCTFHTFSMNTAQPCSLLVSTRVMLTEANIDR